MNPKQFERRIAAVEKRLDDLENSFRVAIFMYATEEEIDILLKVAVAISNDKGGSSISAELSNAAELASARVSKRAKDRSRPHSRKLIPYFPMLTDAIKPDKHRGRVKNSG